MTRLMERLDRLAQFTDVPGKLCRLFLSPAHIAAALEVKTWMREAGMTASIDAVGNVIGRYEAAKPGAQALMFGSHIDTVLDAGPYDGMLGVIAAIEAVDHFRREGRRFPFAIEVVAFGDEENIRFPSTLLGSRALAGKITAAELDAADTNGVTIRAALPAIGGDPAQFGRAARRSEELLAYLELHIEQGPVLESRGLPLGIVTAINGATRWRLAFEGMAGHAGTVPMSLRRDALAGAAEAILAFEEIARSLPGCVATAGQITALPGAPNVIAGRAEFSLDLRHADDTVRSSALAAIEARLQSIAKSRDLKLAIQRYYDASASPCDVSLRQALGQTLQRLGLGSFELPSGAGHDAMALKDLCPIAMLFVRCKGGVSHNPAESMTEADAELSLRALIDFVAHFGERPS